MCRLLGKLQSSLPESLLVVTILSRLFLCVVISISSFVFSRHFCRTVPLPVVSGRDSVVLVDRSVPVTHRLFEQRWPKP